MLINSDLSKEHNRKAIKIYVISIEYIQKNEMRLRGKWENMIDNHKINHHHEMNWFFKVWQ